MFTRRNIMITNVLLFVLSISSLASILPKNSTYYYLVDVLYCDNTQYMRGCRHEIGHKMDYDLGVPSESYEFGQALKGYMLSEFKKDDPSELSKILIEYPGVYYYEPTQTSSTQKELYAAIYSWADGNVSRIPKELRPFYSKDRSYLRLYSCLSKRDNFNVCDQTSFSYIEGVAQ